MKFITSATQMFGLLSCVQHTLVKADTDTLSFKYGGHPVLYASDTNQSDEELLDYIRSIPIRDGYTILESEIVLPMTTTQVYSNFFMTDSKFSVDQALKDLGDSFTDEPEWERATSGFNVDGYKVLKTRTTKFTSQLPSNVLSDTIDNTRNSYLLEASKKSLIIKDVITGSGFHWADSFKTSFLWEVYQTAESEAHQSVLRQSWVFEWVDEPWVGSGTIHDNAVDKVTTTAKYIFDTHFPRSVKKYNLEEKRKAAKSFEAAANGYFEEIVSDMEDLKHTVSH